MRSTAMPTASAPGADDEDVQRAARPLRRCRTGGRGAGSAGVPPRNGAISCCSIGPDRAGSSSMTSRTAACGTAKVRSPTCAISASVIDSVSGSSMTNRVPSPGAVCSVRRAVQLLDRVSSRPPCRRRGRWRGRSRRGSRTRARRAGRAAPPRRADPSGTGRPSARARAATAAASMPRPSSATSSTTVSPTLAADERSVPSSGLPAASRSAGGLEAVADGVAHQVQHRVHHPLDQELVDLGVLAAAARAGPSCRSPAPGRGRRTASAGRSRRPAPAAPA